MSSRFPAVLLVFLGIVALVAGLFVGCGALFSWNGRRPIATYPIEPGTPFEARFEAKRNTRYMLGVQVVFDRAALPERDGELVVEAQMPLVARVLDDAGNVASQAVGWLDTREPPTTLTGMGARPAGTRRAPDVIAERLVGPWPCMRSQRATIRVDLGADRVAPERARILETRAILYDDSVPVSTLAILGTSGAGLGAILVGLALLVRGGSRRRRRISRHARR